MNLHTILGSSGSIGPLLARELRNYTSRIRLVGRNPRKFNDEDEILIADLTIPDMVDKAIAGSDVVYLMIGLEYRTDVWEEKWPRLMRSSIDSCIRHGARLVFFDNVYTYGEDAVTHMTEKSPMEPSSVKGRIRKHLVDMIVDKIHSGNLMALIARSADFYGPGSENSMLNQLVYNRLKNGKSPMWLISADKKHSFTFTADAARATAMLGNTGDAYNQVWHLPSDHNPLTIREIVDIFARELNRDAKITVTPEWVLKIMGLFNPVVRELREMLYQYDRDYIFDSSKFLARFDFIPTTYPDGIRATIRGLTTLNEYAENRIFNLSPK